MKKLLIVLIAVFAVAFTNYANTRDTCVIKGGNGASVVADVTGIGPNEVNVNLCNDASSYVNLTVTVKVYKQSVSGKEYRSGSKTFTVKPGETPVTISLNGEKWVDTFQVSVESVIVSGARCE